MITFRQYLSEMSAAKNKWQFLLSSSDKSELGGELVDLVQNAYAKTTEGSFVKSVRDVLPSDWIVIDWDDDPQQDSVVFYRKSRSGENWKGNKIQGLGHDGQAQSKTKVINKHLELLKKKGWWVEASEAMRHILLKNGAPVVKDESFLQKLFGDPDLKMIDQNTYVRKLPNGKKITETVFGHPTLK